MYIKVIELRRKPKLSPYWVLNFTAKIGDMEVKGEASAFLRNPEVPPAYGVKLKFQNPGVRKHPEYEEIRQRVVTGILEKARKSRVFCGFSSSAGLPNPVQLRNYGTKQ